MAAKSEEIRLKLKVLPDKPGVYQFFDASDKILYVGKAKNLKKRVTSYFNKTLDSGKTRVLVRQIVDIKYIVLIICYFIIEGYISVFGHNNF